MKKTKRILMLLLAVCISFIFCNCGTSDKPQDTANDNSHTEISDTAYSSDGANEPKSNITEV